MQLKRASGYLHYIDCNCRIPYYFNVPPHLLFHSTIHYNHQLRKKKTVIPGTYCDTRLKCLSNSPIYTRGSNLWWWQKWESFAIHLNREAEKYRSLLTPKIDIIPTKSDWNFDGEAGAHMDHSLTGLQDYKCSLILNTTSVFIYFLMCDWTQEHVAQGAGALSIIWDIQNPERERLEL